MQNMHTMGYYLALKRNEVLILTTKWMKLKNIILSEERQSHKITCSMIPFILSIQKRQIHRKRR